MTDKKLTPDQNKEAEKKAAKQKAADRKERWDDEIQRSGHEYQPTPETQKRRDAEIQRDKDRENEK